jgi:hypothetical protein
MKFDSILLTHTHTLSSHHKFTAKTLYALSCITNYLVPYKDALYISNIKYHLRTHFPTLIQITKIQRDASILERLSGLFIRFGEIGERNNMETFLDAVGKGQLNGVLFERLVTNLYALLREYRHEYSNTKAIYMKMLQNTRLKLRQVSLIIMTMRNSCSLNLA